MIIHFVCSSTVSYRDSYTFTLPWPLVQYVTEFVKRGLIHAIINIEKSRFEILNTVYLENAWCLVYEILHQSIVIQGNSVGILFDGLLAELPAILDSFFHQYHK